MADALGKSTGTDTPSAVPTGQGVLNGRYGRRLLIGTVIVVLLAVAVGGAAVRTMRSRLGYTTWRRPTITRQQADQQVARYLAEFLKQLPGSTPPQVTAKLSGACMNDAAKSQPGPHGRYQADQLYLLEVTANHTAQEYLKLLQTYWTSKSYVATPGVAVAGAKGSQRLDFQNPSDRFTFAVEAAPNNALSLDIASPCVWPTGKPTT